MRKVQLYINNERVDLFDDEIISLTQTIKNVKDVSKVFTDFSKSFTIPSSKRNNKIFKHYYNFFITDGFDGRFKAPARIEINDIPFRYGKIKLDGVDMKNNAPYAYKVTFYGNTVNLKDLFGEEKLSSLSLLDDESVVYDSTNILSHLQLDPTVSGNDLVAPLITHTTRLYYDSGDTTAQTGNLYNSGSFHGVAWDQLKYAIRLDKIIQAIEDRYEISFSREPGHFFNTSNLAYYNLFMWLHRNKGEVTSKEEGTLYSRLVSGWSTTQGGGSIITSNALFLQDQNWTDLRFTLSRTGTAPYSISITRNGTEIYAQSGIVSNNYIVDLLYAAQDYASYQVTISYSDTITFTNANWTVNYSGATSADSYDSGSFTANSELQFVITDQIPDMKVIDFITGLFRMFNLTAETENGTDITVKTLDTYYDEGNTIDITSYIDTEQSAIDATVPYKEIEFQYSDTESFLAANHNKLFDEEWAKESYNGDNFQEGETFTVEAPFSHFKYERLIDLTTTGDTSIQWGWSVDDNQDSYIGSPLLFYPILNAHEGILFVDQVGANGEYSSSVSVTAPIVMPSNSLYLDSNTGTDNINFKLEKNEYTRDINFTGTLFYNYYFNYIAGIFSANRRMTKLKAKLPISFLANYSLADKLLISDKEYNINSITTNLNNGMSDLELLNVIDTNALFPFATTQDPSTLIVSVTGENAPTELTQETYTANVSGTATGTITYQWSVTNGTIQGSSTGATVDILWNEVSANTPGSVSVFVTRGGYEKNAALAVTIQNVVVTFNIAITEGGSTTLDTPVLRNTSKTYSTSVSGTATGAITYDWTVSGGSFTGDGTDTIIVNWDTDGTGYVRVDATREGINAYDLDYIEVVPLLTTVDITGVTSPVEERDVATYGSIIGGNTSGDITYSWEVSKGLITGGTNVGGVSVLNGVGATIPNIEVTWGGIDIGTGYVSLTATREGETGADNQTVEVLPIYWIFEACDGGETVIDRQYPFPSTNDRYANYALYPVEYYIHNGFNVNNPAGWTIIELQPTGDTGCPTTTTPPPSSISITGPFEADTAGESGVTYTVTTDPQTVIWTLSDGPLAEFNPIDITFTTSTSGEGNGSFQVTFGPYNGDGSETLRSLISATEINPEFGNDPAVGSITVSQSPPPPVYYIFNPCLVSGSTVMQTFAFPPASNQRAVDSALDYYTYSGTSTTDPTLYPIVGLTLQSITGCPDENFSWAAERNDGGATGFVGPYSQNYNEGDEVLVNDGSGICWLLGAPSTTSPTYTITGICNTTTTTTTTTTTVSPTCNAVDLSLDTYLTLNAACQGGAGSTPNRDRTDGDGATVGDIVYEDAGCTTTKSSGIYYNITAGAAIEIGAGGVITDVQYC